MTQEKDKVQKFFEAWAEFDAYIHPLQCEKLGFKTFIDLSFHIWNVFFYNMFYKCVKGEEDLPNLEDKNLKNNPINWLKCYEASSYFYQDEQLEDYISMQLGVVDSNNPSCNVFVIFKKSQSDYDIPYKLVAISSCKTVYGNNDKEQDWQTVIEIATYSKARRLFPFEKVEDVVFKCDLIPNLDNPGKLLVNYVHIKKDHPERLKKADGGLYTAANLYDMVIKACHISKHNYRYAYPVVYYDADEKKKETGGFKRGFLLPLMDNGVLVLVALVVETRPNSLRYRIPTFLVPDHAIKNAKRFSLIEENWIVKYTNNNEPEVVEKKE